MQRSSTTVCLLALTLGACSGVDPRSVDDRQDLEGGHGGHASQGGMGARGGEGNQGGEITNGACALPPPRIALLSPSQYDKTVATLLPDAGQPSALFQSTYGSEVGFSNDANVLRLGPQHFEALFETARTLSTKVGAVGWAHPCLLAAADEACVTGFVTSFGRRAFRRPLASDEVSRYVALHALLRKAASVAQSAQALVRAFLMSPHFLFRTELGETSVAGLRLNAWERASALSYLLTEGPPDEALSAAAASNELLAPTAMAAHARRLLANAQTAPGLLRFFRELFRYDEVVDVVKDAALEKVLTASLRTALRDETDTFVSHVVWSGEGTVAELLSADYTLANDKVKGFYGFGTGDDQFRETPLPSSSLRAGLLTQASLMARLAKNAETDVVGRGHFVREAVLCQEVPPPPENLVFPPVQDDGKTTARQRLAAHGKSTCAACHAMMDPIGFALESFDTIGRFRSQENQLPIDTKGTLTGTSNDGDFDNARSLFVRIAHSVEARQCFAQNLFQYAHARKPDEVDECGLASVAGEMDRNGGNFRELVVSLVSSELFLNRRAP